MTSFTFVVQRPGLLSPVPLLVADGVMIDDGCEMSDLKHEKGGKKKHHLYYTKVD